MPAEKGGLRTVDVSLFVCLWQSVLNDQSEVSSMTMQYGPILMDQSQGREGVEGECVSLGRGSEGRG